MSAEIEIYLKHELRTIMTLLSVQYYCKFVRICYFASFGEETRVWRCGCRCYFSSAIPEVFHGARSRRGSSWCLMNVRSFRPEPASLTPFASQPITLIMLGPRHQPK